MEQGMVAIWSKWCKWSRHSTCLQSEPEKHHPIRYELANHDALFPIPSPTDMHLSAWPNEQCKQEGKRRECTMILKTEHQNFLTPSKDHHRLAATLREEILTVISIITVREMQIQLHWLKLKRQANLIHRIQSTDWACDRTVRHLLQIPWLL